MPSVQDGPSSSLFSPMSLKGNVSLSESPDLEISNEMALALELAPSGACVGWVTTMTIHSA